MTLLAACGGNGDDNPQDTLDTNEQTETENVVPDPTETTNDHIPDLTETPEDSATDNPIIDNNSDFDLSTREGSQAFYEHAYLASKISGGNNWTHSNINNCTAGVLSAEHINKAVTRINYFRTLVGSPDISDSTAMNNKAQLAAFVAQLQFDMGNGLTSQFHVPRKSDGSLLDWSCLTEDAAEAFAKGNIAQHPSSRDIVFSIDLFIWDPGVNNSSAGHRDGLFKSNLTHVGIGASSEAAVVMMNNTGDSSGIWMWPPSDVYVPSTVLSPYGFGLPRWSIRNEKAWILRASKANHQNITPSVDVIDCKGSNVAVSNIKIADNKLLTWEVDINYANIIDECEYNVHISNYYTTTNEGDGAATGSLGSFEYKTTIFKPNN